MVSANQARTAAERYIQRKVQPQLSEQIIVAAVDEHEYCWVATYNTRRFVETGDFRHALAGNGPLIINKATGALREGVSAVPIESQLDAE